ncbi:hypothetical protein SAMN05444342_0957 [Haladaptatus paucihalophilus DX253]|uniref:Uncharacterized protein n=1 Tax=Haladaptatus paucihalophilus DX253 TaxID=797209 RepID=A0A1M6QLD3_HALPU|nr:hypothetical protein SAMN05444342_0957 [Haladaptatus paucihalophilus DX253]
MSHGDLSPMDDLSQMENVGIKTTFLTFHRLGGNIE